MATEQKTFNVLVTNIDKNVTVETLTSFFSFTGKVVEVRLSKVDEETQQAIIVFDSEESVKTAELMTGALLEAKRIEIAPTQLTQSTTHDTVFRGDTLPERKIPDLPAEHTKASVAASLIAQGYILASDSFQKAVQFDKDHNISDTIKAKAAAVKNAAINVDEQYHITEYLALGATMAVSYASGINEKYKITETVSTTAKEIDNALGISNGVGAAKQAIDNGISKVVQSEPVVKARTAVSSSINEFSNEVSQEVGVRKNLKDLEKIECEKEQNETKEENDTKEIVVENPPQFETTPLAPVDVPQQPVQDQIVTIPDDVDSPHNLL
ncbi:protein vip1, putative [Entamoeba invadens IP1]|uniref:Protein vip1, putative n=1 Tax=Entamoeba invadens IP1 TaxID=370355 RepID=A0A0A1UBN8_ENTIV|nr:protein vip1, putative [Entamoeba invadens IP1]ELP92625.1 protein vip1, putative [Entamoeba invadens IP1]|eukprot:XP_004259396.1 protein vip1, putative [Entamoeba invadens IP1]